jgi:hypothetical protein
MSLSEFHALKGIIIQSVGERSPSEELSMKTEST